MDVLFPFTWVWRQHMNAFFNLLNSEDNTWMLFTFSIYLILMITHECFVHLHKSADNTWMFFYLLKSEDNTWMSICPFTYAWRRHMDVFFLSIYLSLKTTHGCFFHLLKSKTIDWCFFYLRKSEENTWIFSFHLLKSEDNTRMFFFICLSLKTTHGYLFLSIYLSLMTTHECFLHLLKCEDTLIFFHLL